MILIFRWPAFFSRARIRASGLFDAEWYRLAHLSSTKKDIDPLTHFLRHGKRYRLSPSRAFDTERYLEEYEDARFSNLNPLLYYLRYGRALGHTTHPAPASAADRIAESSLFDPAWYLNRYPDVAVAGYPPLLHYLRFGAPERRSPGPDFDAEWYLQQYRDIDGINPLVHYIDHGRDEGRNPVPLTKIIDLAREIVASVEDLDPELYTYDFFENPDSIKIVSGRPRHPVARAFEKIVAAIETPPRVIIFMPWLTHGGADLVACHAIRAAQEQGLGEILVVLSDHDHQEALHLLPPDVSCVSFSRIDAGLSLHQRTELVEVLVRGLQPDAVLNVNSHACWEALKRYGWRLKHFTRLYAMLFCHDFAPSGRLCGYSDRYLRYCLPTLSGVYFDNQSYIGEVIRQFGIPLALQSRLVPLYQPAPATTPKSPRTVPDGRLSILWTGRLARQKNVKLLMQIAELAPQFDFHIWGRGDETLKAELEDLSRRLSHVHFHGAFENFDRLPFRDYDVLLYTSLWDGLPNVLLEGASVGLAIVASNVGGIGELVNGDTGWLISALDDPGPYVSALEELACNPNTMQMRINAMNMHLVTNHNWERYRHILSTEPSITKGFLYVESHNERSGPSEAS